MTDTDREHWGLSLGEHLCWSCGIWPHTIETLQAGYYNFVKSNRHNQGPKKHNKCVKHTKGQQAYWQIFPPKAEAFYSVLMEKIMV